jgi:ribulose-phosphate 3-epimerase
MSQIAKRWSEYGEGVSAIREYILAPSILTADFWALGGAADAARRAGARYLHFDVMDGHFVDNISFGIPVLSSVRRHTDMLLDVHLMVKTPARFLEAFAKHGADIVSVHIEALERGEIRECIDKIRALGKRASLALSPNTPVEAVFPYAGEVDMALIMSVAPGYGGQELLPFTLKKAEALADYVSKHGFGTDIEMDGGIELSNLRSVLDAGVNVVVAGSALFGAADIAAEAGRFMEVLRGYEEGRLCVTDSR